MVITGLSYQVEILVTIGFTQVLPSVFLVVLRIRCGFKMLSKKDLNRGPSLSSFLPQYLRAFDGD